MVLEDQVWAAKAMMKKLVLTMIWKLFALMVMEKKETTY